MTDLLPTEDEALLADQARAWVDGEHPVSRFRALRDAGRTWDPALWDELRELGWPAIGLDADGMGLPARIAICEALGRNLVPTPLISAWLAADLDPECDGGSGEVRALAWEEHGSRGRPGAVHAHVRDGRLWGHKVAALDPGPSTAWLVTAREAGSVGVYRVALADGAVTPLSRIDHRDAANVAFDGAPATRIAEADALERALDRATVALSAEMLGGMSAALERTITYVKERVQFGVAIGSFQVVQHRLVDCFIAVELARSCVLAAAREPTVARVALAKARCGDAYDLVAREAIQLHGGIGVTDEHDVGFYYKRATVTGRLFGDAAHHRDRWGRAHGY